MVSVIVPNYNHAAYLRQRIDSILNQTFQDFELIILDDCSTDNSREVIESYRTHPKVSQIVYNEQNGGTTFKQWNKGFALATGKYVWIAESDDYADERFLETLVGTLEAHPEAGIAWCDSWRVDEQNRKHGNWAPVFQELDNELWSGDFVLEGSELVRRFMPGWNIIPNASAVLMRRSSLALAGAAPEEFRVAGDWVYWIRFLQTTKGAYISTPLNYFRFHQRNVRSGTETNGILLLERAQVLHFVTTLVTPEPGSYQRAVDALIEAWFHAYIYYRVPKSRHQAFFREMEAAAPGFGWKLRKRVVSFLFRNRLSGIKMLIRDKLLRNIFSNRPTAA